MREAKTNKAKQDKCILRDVGLINIDYSMAFSISSINCQNDIVDTNYTLYDIGKHNDSQLIHWQSLVIS